MLSEDSKLRSLRSKASNFEKPSDLLFSARVRDTLTALSKSQGKYKRARSRCKGAVGSLSQQSEKFLFQQSRKFLFRTGKLAG